MSGIARSTHSGPKDPGVRGHKVFLRRHLLLPRPIGMGSLASVTMIAAGPSGGFLYGCGSSGGTVFILKVIETTANLGNPVHGVDYCMTSAANPRHHDVSVNSGPRILWSKTLFLIIHSGFRGRLGDWHSGLLEEVDGFRRRNAVRHRPSFRGRTAHSTARPTPCIQRDAS